MQPPLTDNNFKHAVDYDSQLLPYKFYHTSVMNGIPDVLFIGTMNLKSTMFTEGQLATISTTIISIVRLATLSLFAPMLRIPFTRLNSGARDRYPPLSSGYARGFSLGQNQHALSPTPADGCLQVCSTHPSPRPRLCRNQTVLTNHFRIGQTPATLL